MRDFEPDWDYLIDAIADAYRLVQESLDQDRIDQACFWQDHLELLVDNLRRYLARTS